MTVKECIELGKITVNEKKVDMNYRLKNGNTVEHQMHRHENPVLDTPIEIISECEDLIVINKPSSIPCHPCGRYRFNSVVFILGKEFGCSNLRTIYRLDRLTSGVLICGKTDRKTKELENQISKKQVQKEYVCRVQGEFPVSQVEVNQPMGCMSHKLAVWRVDPLGKPSVTRFERLSYNGKSSVVKCYPLTGRTHQIRVHLQYLGYPIINDPVYNSTAFGPERGKNGNFDGNLDEICENIMKEHNIGLWVDGENPLYAEQLAEVKEQKQKLNNIESKSENESLNNTTGTSENSVLTLMRNKFDNGVDSANDDTGEPDPKRVKVDQTITEKGSHATRLGFDLSKWIPSEKCRCCRNNYIDPTKKQLTMFLHALKYKGPNWEYETSLPDWAVADWHGEEEEDSL